MKKSPAQKKFPFLSPAVAEARYEVTEWLKENADYSDEQCSEMSLKEMVRAREIIDADGLFARGRE